MRPAAWVALVVVWAAALYGLSSRPRLPAGPEIPHFDKVLHAGYFMLGSVFFYLACRDRRRPFSASRLVWLTLLFAAVIGALDEWHQSFVPGRSGNDVGDWMADVTGGVLGLVVGGRVWRWLRGWRADESR